MHVPAPDQRSQPVVFASRATMAWQRSEVQQRNTATTALSNAFGCIQMRSDQRNEDGGG